MKRIPWQVIVSLALFVLLIVGLIALSGYSSDIKINRIENEIKINKIVEDTFNVENIDYNAIHAILLSLEGKLYYKIEWNLNFNYMIYLYFKDGTFPSENAITIYGDTIEEMYADLLKLQKTMEDYSQ